MVAIPTWTAVKHALYSQFEELVTRKSYVAFTGDCRIYHLERKGQSCLYDVPLNQRGALSKFAGKRVRLVCGAERLEQVLMRHTSVEGGDPFGTPDLFLFACDRTGNYSIARFVEVKRPDEKLKPTQRPEIEFLNHLGLKARVVRLIERTLRLTAKVPCLSRT